MEVHRFRQLLLRGAATGSALCALAWAPASLAGDNTIDFNLPRQPLAVSLRNYAQISGQQIIVASDVVNDLQAPPVHGTYTPDGALNQILKGSKLVAERSPSGAVMIERPPAPEKPMQLAAATPKPVASTALETVIVTAQKQREDIQTVPIAVTAMSQKDLTDRQIAAGPDLLKEVPNMNFGKTNFSGYSIELRGIGTQAISVTTDPAVAVAFNGIPFLRNHFFEQEFYDVDNIEVLRGPQGTLYGRNATAGVVNLKSALPTDQYEAMASVDIGNYDNRRLEGMANIPIVGDVIDLRLAGEWTKRDGYTDDTTLNTSVDGRDLWSTRATLGFKPTNNFQADLIWEHFSEDDNRLRSGKQLCETAPPVTSVNGVAVPTPDQFGDQGNGALVLGQNYTSQGCQATSLYAKTAFQVPYGPSLPYVIAAYSEDTANPYVDPYASTTQSTNLRDIESSILPTYRAKNDTLEFNATYTINSELTLTSQTGYNEDYLWSTEDYNRFDTSPGFFSNQFNSIFPYPQPPAFKPDPAAGQNGVPSTSEIFCDPQLGCSDRLLLEDLDVEHAWQASQELRLASDYSGPFNFSVGGNYLHYETEENYYVFANALTAYSEIAGNPENAGTNGCLRSSRFLGGYQAPNPLEGGGQPAFSCVYIDPNPIGNLNNQGHNYFLSQNPYTLNSYAIFGEAYYNITDDLKLTGGIRWTVDQKHFVNIPSEVITQGIGYFNSGSVNQEWDRPTGRAVLNWTPQVDFTDQTLLYASYAHGYKAGGANPPGAVFDELGSANTPFIVHPATFKPEYIEAFELGTKNTLLDGTMTLNADVFYYNYTGYQISEIVDRTAINNNYNAHVEGAELESVYEPTPGLKFNFAGGWEDTGVAGGTYGIDLMDRTGGMPGWMVLKPFATQASNCILPTYVVAAILQEQVTPVSGNPYGGGVGPFACQVAYINHLDPVTGLAYVPNPTGVEVPFNNNGFPAPIPAGYPGFNPLNPAINNGEGFAKNLAGHKLPNAPPFTVSFGTQYTIPVSTNWAATLRGDFYWQADSWARIFNDNPYDQLRDYSTVNFALMLDSADGWQVMGYVKNVFDTTAITGDFLNSDDSGLTTNVFLTDPRLFGIRVTKHLDDGEGFWGSDYSGADLFSLFTDTGNGRPVLWIELGGQAEQAIGQGDVFAPSWLANYPGSAVLQNPTPVQAQHPAPFSLGYEAKLSYQPAGSDWVISAAARYGRSSNNHLVHHETNGIHHQKYASGLPVSNTNMFSQDKFADTRVNQVQSHSVLDFMTGKDIGLGMLGLDGSSTLSAGVRFAQFTSNSSFDLRARPDLHFFYFPSAAAPNKFNAGPYFHTYHNTESASREFLGIGPSISWDASKPIFGAQQVGEVSFDLGANGAVLFGRQKTRVNHHGSGHYYPKSGFGLYSHATLHYQKTGGHTSDRNVIVPNLGGFAGASYRIDNAKISFGYRADFFFGAIDGGIDYRKSETLGFFGPFANISIGLGG